MPTLNEKITRLYEELQLSANKDLYDRVMKELLEESESSGKSQLLKHVLNVFDTSTVQSDMTPTLSASDVSERAITEFSNSVVFSRHSRYG